MFFSVALHVYTSECIDSISGPINIVCPYKTLYQILSTSCTVEDGMRVENYCVRTETTSPQLQLKLWWKKQTSVIQIHQIIIKSDYSELFLMFSVTKVSSLVAKSNVFVLLKQKWPCNIPYKVENTGWKHWIINAFLHDCIASIAKCLLD